ncbi:hypothetical protein SETIT_8G039100v2 [Setaria italica]|uniref:Uncharacterized protein n=1 Tax=Setaria italica TaxID=4555 RepID=A0A368S3Y9_SETIT|nr:hypothetical protein SETIT_8G039100v2 [Setaria italica]
MGHASVPHHPLHRLVAPRASHASFEVRRAQPCTPSPTNASGGDQGRAPSVCGIAEPSEIGPLISAVMTLI